MKDNKHIKQNSDGSMEVTVIFDPFGHQGHYLSKPKPYSISHYKQMVDSKETQIHIANGYALGGYTHDIRHPVGHLLETDAFGNKIIPSCKTLSMTWNSDNTITHKQLVLNNTEGKEIQKLILQGVGGFSSVHNLNTSTFYGLDYVATPRYSSNRVIIANSCNGGVCNAERDSSIDLPTSAETAVTAYLDSIGIESKATFDALVKLETNSIAFNEQQQIMDGIFSLKEKANTSEEIARTYTESIGKNFALVMSQLQELGFVVTEDFQVMPSQKSLSNLFKPASLDSAMSLDESFSQRISNQLRKPSNGNNKPVLARHAKYLTS